MFQLEGFVVKRKEKKVCKLFKALYGLKQAYRAWYEKLTEHLLKLNYKLFDLDDTTLIVKKIGKDCNLVATPMEHNLKLTSTKGSIFEDPTKYRQLVGSLNFLTTTRPDIVSVAGILSRFMHKPCEGHWNIAKRVIKYLKGTQTYGIKCSKVAYFHLTSYSDSDFDGDNENGVSTSHYLMSLRSITTSWRSHKKSILADSTIEVEYVAVAQATKEIIWLRKILEDLQEKQKTSTALLIDNSSTIQFAKNPKFHDRSKHINTKYHLIRHYVEAKVIHLTHSPTSEQITDIFTKPLGHENFEKFRMLLNM
eukprot:PITA_30861